MKGVRYMYTMCLVMSAICLNKMYTLAPPYFWHMSGPGPAPSMHGAFPEVRQYSSTVRLQQPAGERSMHGLMYDFGVETIKQHIQS